ncbi:MAG: Minf_1886 family protein [Verrucomicrobiota bacterium]|jgi:uncharacterized repeat protein (TIGR04138 family)
MRPANLEDDIRKIVAADPRFPYEAYIFVQEALQYTQRALGRTKSEHKHVAGKELLDGLRQYALDSFGPMVPTVLGEWGIHSCEDIGEIVFNMIEHGVASKTETDSRADFKGHFSFDDAFRKPFLPTKTAASAPKAPKPKITVGD